MSLKKLFTQFVKLVHPDLLLSHSSTREITLLKNRRILQFANTLMEHYDSKSTIILNTKFDPLHYFTFKDGMLTDRHFIPKIYKSSLYCPEKLLLQLFKSAGLSISTDSKTSLNIIQSFSDIVNSHLNSFKKYKSEDIQLSTTIPILIKSDIINDHLKISKLKNLFTDMLPQPHSLWKIIFTSKEIEPIKYHIISEAFLVVVSDDLDSIV